MELKIEQFLCKWNKTWFVIKEKFLKKKNIFLISEYFMKKEGHVLKTFVSLFSKRNCIKTKTQAETQSIYN